eukprot:6837072-Alexandrium_andersonii.AAC.1
MPTLALFLAYRNGARRVPQSSRPHPPPQPAQDVPPVAATCRSSLRNYLPNTPWFLELLRTHELSNTLARPRGRCSEAPECCTLG